MTTLEKIHTHRLAICYGVLSVEAMQDQPPVICNYHSYQNGPHCLFSLSVTTLINQ